MIFFHPPTFLYRHRYLCLHIYFHFNATFFIPRNTCITSFLHNVFLKKKLAELGKSIVRTYLFSLSTFCKNIYSKNIFQYFKDFATAKETNIKFYLKLTFILIFIFTPTQLLHHIPTSGKCSRLLKENSCACFSNRNSMHVGIL